MDNQSNYELASKLLTKVLGLSADAAETVIRSINKAGEISKIRSNSIRHRIGNRSIELLSQAIKYIGDSNPVMKEEENKSNDFKSFLINEVTIEIDPNADASVTQSELRKKTRMAKASPERVAKQEQIAAQEKRKEAAKDSSPLASLERQVAIAQERLSALQVRLEQRKKRQQ